MTQHSIQLYSLATPNGQKIGVALEEMGLAYDAHRIDIMRGDQFTEEFKKINPNSKIPAITDLDGPHGKPINIMESGAILIYLAEKSGKFLPSDPALRCVTLQWLFFQVGGIGPMFGQFGHFFRYAKDKCLDPYPLERYSNEAKRLLAVLEHQLGTHTYIAGREYTIADMAIFPWINALHVFYKADEQLELDQFNHVKRWLAHCLQRPAVQKGMLVCK